MVLRTEIEAAILGGCKNLDAVMNRTTAGLGQCGGTCRPDLEKLLKGYLETGQFPELANRKAPPKR